jgi:hypothetical protein
VNIDKIGKDIPASFDRFKESLFWIHRLEEFYHYAEPFRWHLNAFLKAIKEVPSLLSMELQNREGFPQWFSNERERLKSNPLLSFLSRQRDFVVHRGMLVPQSHGGIGCMEGKGLKVGVSLPIDPGLNSDDAMHRYLFIVAVQNDDFLSLLNDDEESLPCIHRIWRLEQFEEEIVELASRAWAQTGETLGSVSRWLGIETSSRDGDCPRETSQFQFKTYNRKALKKEMQRLRETVRSMPDVPEILKPK